MFDSRPLETFDPALAAALRGELDRQERHIELIASENYVSPRVLAAQGSVLTNKYADGYPGHRHYAGCEHADVAESLAIERACKLFGAGWANVQPYSGSHANLAAYLALLELSRGVDGLITDKPDLAREVIERRAQMTDSQRFLLAQLIRLGASTQALESEDALRP